MDRLTGRPLADPDAASRLPWARRRFDANADGRIGEEEWHALLRALDQDGDSTIAPTEAAVGALCDDHAVARLADIDGNGLVGIDEARALGRLADRNVDGRISFEEVVDLRVRTHLAANPWVLEHFGRSAPGALGPAHAERLVKEADDDGDGLLSPEEARTFLVRIVPHGEKLVPELPGLKAPGRARDDRILGLGKQRREGREPGRPPDFLKTYDY
jgi:Ca2+-binding EF-hand superfamily protein